MAFASPPLRLPWLIVTQIIMALLFLPAITSGDVEVIANSLLAQDCVDEVQLQLCSKNKVSPANRLNSFNLITLSLIESTKETCNHFT